MNEYYVICVYLLLLFFLYRAGYSKVPLFRMQEQSSRLRCDGRLLRSADLCNNSEW